MRREKTPEGHASTDESPSDRTLAFHVLRKLRRVFRAAEWIVQIRKDRRVTGAQFWALNEIHTRPGIKVGDLARKMALHQSTISNLIGKLVSTGLVHKRRDKADARTAHLYVTSAGKRVINGASYPKRGILLETIEQFPLRTLDKLNRNLDHLLQQMHEKATKGNFPTRRE
jgi:DNA-binding MarR family transcriptional regulator